MDVSEGRRENAGNLQVRNESDTKLVCLWWVWALLSEDNNVLIAEIKEGCMYIDERVRKLVREYWSGWLWWENTDKENEGWREKTKHWIKKTTGIVFTYILFSLQIRTGAPVPYLPHFASPWWQCLAGWCWRQRSPVADQAGHSHGWLQPLPARDLQELRQGWVEGGHQGD